jgi:hypothetical protein
MDYKRGYWESMVMGSPSVVSVTITGVTDTKVTEVELMGRGGSADTHARSKQHHLIDRSGDIGNG